MRRNGMQETTSYNVVSLVSWTTKNALTLVETKDFTVNSRCIAIPRIEFLHAYYNHLTYILAIANLCDHRKC